MMEGQMEPEVRLWRTVDGLRSRSGDDYCILHGEFRCPECSETDRDWQALDAEEEPIGQ